MLAAARACCPPSSLGDTATHLRRGLRALRTGERSFPRGPGAQGSACLSAGSGSGLLAGRGRCSGAAVLGLTVGPRRWLLAGSGVRWHGQPRGHSAGSQIPSVIVLPAALRSCVLTHDGCVEEVELSHNVGSQEL